MQNRDIKINQANFSSQRKLGSRSGFQVKLGMTLACSVLFIVFSGVSYAGVLDLSRIGIGARSLGMGRAQVAGFDLGAAFINPAGFGDFETFRMTSMYTSLSDDVQFNIFGIGIPLKEGAFGGIGIGYVGAGVAGISVTSSETRTAPISTSDYSNRLLLVSYGRDITPFVQGGITAKFLTRSFESLQNASASGTDMDLGFLFYPRDNLTAGVVIQNILNTQLSWKTNTAEDMPSNMKFGINFKAKKVLSILLDYDSNNYLHAGLEWNPKEFLHIRGGVENVPTSKKESILNFSLGLGLSARGFSFDYAYYIDSLVSQNSSHFFSMSFILPQKTEEMRPIMPANVEENSVSLI